MSEFQSHVASYTQEVRKAIVDGWDHFWFRAIDPATLCLIRILAGCMIFYTHLVWTLDLNGFLGENSRISDDFVSRFHDPLRSGFHFAWSFWHYIQSPGLICIVHCFCLLTIALFTVGAFSRVTSVLTWLITLSYAHRLPGTLFGLDQINVMLAMYLAIGPCGACYSIDRWRAQKKRTGPVRPLVSANVAIRLMQLHLCVIYLFAGFGKLLGASWWDGTAIWLSFANLEYQSINMTWLCRFPRFLNLMTHVALAWEVAYIALIWPRLTRPFMVLMAIPIHLGIAMCLGMITFGMVMLIANLAFVSPVLIRAIIPDRSAPNLSH